MPAATDKFTGDLRSPDPDVPDFQETGFSSATSTPLCSTVSRVSSAAWSICAKASPRRSPLSSPAIESRGLIFGAAAATMLVSGSCSYASPASCPGKPGRAYQLRVWHRRHRDPRRRRGCRARAWPWSTICSLLAARGRGLSPAADLGGRCPGELCRGTGRTQRPGRSWAMLPIKALIVYP